jgi:hypothetical protein
MNIRLATKIRLLLLGFLLSLPMLCSALEPKSPAYSFFMPPKNWLMADPKTLPPRVKISFLSKISSGYCPSINLATEKVKLSLKEYLQAIKKIHEADPESRWREIGKIRTQAGVAALTEFDTQCEWGPVRLIQMILIQDNTAYILTGSALKEEFSKHYADFEIAFRSFHVTGDLFSVIPDTSRKAALQEQCKNLQEAFRKQPSELTWEEVFASDTFQKEHWMPFQSKVIANFSDLGAPWQVEMLQFAKETFALDRISSAHYKNTQIRFEEVKK